MRLYLAIPIVAVATVLAGCGAAEKPPPIPGTDKEQVIGTLAAFAQAGRDDDGELPCSFLTERGRRWLVWLSDNPEGNLHAPPTRSYDPDDCPEIASEFSEYFRALSSEVAKLKPRLVSIRREGALLDQPGHTGNLMGFRRDDGRWLIVFPIFTGR